MCGFRGTPISPAPTKLQFFNYLLKTDNNARKLPKTSFMVIAALQCIVYLCVSSAVKYNIRYYSTVRTAPLRLTNFPFSIYYYRVVVIDERLKIICNCSNFKSKEYFITTAYSYLKYMLVNTFFSNRKKYKRIFLIVPSYTSCGTHFGNNGNCCTRPVLWPR